MAFLRARQNDVARGIWRIIKRVIPLAVDFDIGRGGSRRLIAVGVVLALGFSAKRRSVPGALQERIALVGMSDSLWHRQPIFRVFRKNHVFESLSIRDAVFG